MDHGHTRGATRLRACGDPGQRCALGNAARESCSPFVRFRGIFSAGLAMRLGGHHRQAVVWRAGVSEMVTLIASLPHRMFQRMVIRKRSTDGSKARPVGPGPRGERICDPRVCISTPGRSARAQSTPNTSQSLCRLPTVF